VTAVVKAESLTKRFGEVTDASARTKQGARRSPPAAPAGLLLTVGGRTKQEPQLRGSLGDGDVLCQASAWIADVGWLSSAARSALRAARWVTAAPAIRWVAMGWGW
jgi:hypothetical protein